MSYWNSKQNADGHHGPRAAKTYRVLHLSKERAQCRKPVRAQTAERGSLRPAAGVLAWPLRRLIRTDLPLQARMDMQPASILPSANAGERLPARPAIPTVSH